MSRKILYFINPISGPGSKISIQNIIVKKNLRESIAFEIVNSSADGAYPVLRDKIEKENFTDVVICGGDGTVNQIVSSLIDVDVNIGILPAGSGNGLAFAAKIPKDINKALQIIFKGKASYIDAFFINEKFSCMLCGIGFDAQVAHDFAKQPQRGLATYVKESLKNFVKAKPYKFDIELKGETFSAEAFFISVANSNQFGNNFTIAPKASLEDGLLDIIVVKKMSKLRMAWAVLKQIRAGDVKHQKEKNFHENEVLYFQTDELVIYNDTLAPLHIDGDPADTDRKFTIKILPKAFKLIQP